MLNVIALIPARGGSRGIPAKNMQPVGGLTLIQRAIRSAAENKFLSSVHVTSESQEILNAAKNAGAEPHLRSSQASSDSARASQVVLDFLDSHQCLTEHDVILYLQPTSPFRSSNHVKRAFQQFRSGPAQSLVSVVKADKHLEKSLLLDGRGLLAAATENSDFGVNRQNLPMRVYPNGAIYIFTVGAFQKFGDIPVSGASPFMMGKVESIDIDDWEDLIIARAVADSAGI